MKCIDRGNILYLVKEMLFINYREMIILRFFVDEINYKKEIKCMREIIF